MTAKESRSHWFAAFTLKHLGNEDMFYIVVWVLVFAMQISRAFYDKAIGISDTIHWKYIFDDWIGLLPFLLLFLLSKWVFEPKLFFRQKVRSYILLSLLSAAIITFSFSLYSAHHIPLRIRDRIETIHQLRKDNPSIPEFNPPSSTHHYQFWSQFLSLFSISVLVMGTSLCISIVFRTRKETLQFKVEEAEKVKTELDYLKYQINPHFFMNTLNNIHALVDIDSDTAKDAIIELSRLMRYMLYETSMPTVPLYKELEFQRHFIDLMRLRFDESVHIEYVVPQSGDVFLNYQVPPLIGIVFIENAFKYGISHHGESYIKVRYESLPDSLLHFHCENSNYRNEIMTQSASGLGIDNVIKRLDLLYPGKYKLELKPTEKVYSVDLFIPLQ